MDKLTYLLLAFLCATVFIGCAAVTFSETGDTAEVKETTQKEKSTVTAETTEKAETTANTEAATTASNVSDSNDAGERVDGVKTIALSDNNISYSGSGIIALKNTVVINEGGSYALSGTLSDGKIIVDTADEVRLILSGVNITSSKSSAIEFIGTGGAVIEIAENTINRLSDEKLKKKDVDNEDAVIYSNSDITVTGGGRLDITGNRRGALYARNKLAVYDGIINIEKSYEGMESDGELIINGGNIHIISSDDALNAADNIVINGGYIYAESKGDGFDSNGDMSINGGEIYIFAANKKNSPLDVSDGDKIGNFYINGGTVVAGGGDNRLDVDSLSRQGFAWVYPTRTLNKKESVKVSIISEDGSEIIAFTAPKEFELLFISTDKLELGDNMLDLRIIA